MGLTVEPEERLQRLDSPVPQVQLWLLDLTPGSADRDRAHLDDADSRRVAGLRRPDADRLLARRALVRHAVAASTGCDPRAVAPCYGPGPRSITAGDTGSLYLSSSSSGARGVLALSLVPVGVDVERSPGPLDAGLVSRELLAPPEWAWIRTGGECLPDRFLDVWVRKEAVVKCTGEGMSRDLRSFIVDATSPAAPVLTSEGSSTGMRTYPLEVSDHAAALAVSLAGDFWP